MLEYQIISSSHASIFKLTKVAHMTKSEMDYFDIALIGPMLIFLNQYFDVLVDEEYLLYFSLVREEGKWIVEWISRIKCRKIEDSLFL